VFTGLVQAVGSVSGIDPSPAGVRIRIDPGEWAHAPEVGESIAVSGCCLTLAEPASGTLAFDAIPETLAKTTLGDLKPGERVNLEHAMRADALVGGHFVQGHVDGVGRVESITTEGEWRVRVRPPTDLMRYLAPKGSVTIAGVSLTVAALNVDAGWFEVALIPTTLELTTLGALKPGDGVNLEMDMIAKTVVHHLDHYANR